jgi:hypothetical protein
VFRATTQSQFLRNPRMGPLLYLHKAVRYIQVCRIYLNLHKLQNDDLFFHSFVLVTTEATGPIKHTQTNSTESHSLFFILLKCKEPMTVKSFTALTLERHLSGVGVVRNISQSIGMATHKVNLFITSFLVTIGF